MIAKIAAEERGLPGKLHQRSPRKMSDLMHMPVSESFLGVRGLESVVGLVYFTCPLGVTLLHIRWEVGRRGVPFP